MNTAPIFSPEAQETFTPGARVFLPSTPMRHDDLEGTYLGSEASAGGEEMAVVEWDRNPSNGRPHVVRRESFSVIRNLYR